MREKLSCVSEQKVSCAGVASALGTTYILLNSTACETWKYSDSCGYEYISMSFVVIIGAHLIIWLRKLLIWNVPTCFIRLNQCLPIMFHTIYSGFPQKAIE